MHFYGGMAQLPQVTPDNVAGIAAVVRADQRKVAIQKERNCHDLP